MCIIEDFQTTANRICTSESKALPPSGHYVTKSHPVIHHLKAINKKRQKYDIFMSLFWPWPKTRSIITFQRFKGYVPTFVSRKYQNVMVIVTVLTALKQKFHY